MLALHVLYVQYAAFQHANKVYSKMTFCSCTGGEWLLLVEPRQHGQYQVAKRRVLGYEEPYGAGMGMLKCSPLRRGQGVGIRCTGRCRRW